MVVETDETWDSHDSYLSLTYPMVLSWKQFKDNNFLYNKNREPLLRRIPATEMG